jgi:thioredoxin 1
VTGKSSRARRRDNGRARPYETAAVCGRQTAKEEMVAEVKTLTDASFEKEIGDAATPMIVDFWAPWCGPCRMVGPVIEEIAADHDGKVVVGKLNVDENPGTASKFGIMSIPTIILFKDGEPAKKVIGARS